MSTQHRDNSVVADDNNKPEIITYYNNTKSGVDILDKLARTCLCKCATARWTVVFFFNLVDIAAYNVLVLWITMNPNWHQDKSHARCLFLRELDMSLINDHASERLTHHSGKRRRIQVCAHRSGILADRPSLTSSKSSGDGRCNTSTGMQDDTLVPHLWHVHLQAA